MFEDFLKIKYDAQIALGGDPGKSQRKYRINKLKSKIIDLNSAINKVKYIYPDSYLDKCLQPIYLETANLISLAHKEIFTLHSTISKMEEKIDHWENEIDTVEEKLNTLLTEIEAHELYKILNLTGNDYLEHGGITIKKTPDGLDLTGIKNTQLQNLALRIIVDNLIKEYK